MRMLRDRLRSTAQVMAPGVHTTGSHWLVPRHLYDPIRQGAILTKRGSRNPAAVAFLEFLREPEATAIILAHGYGVE